jgi:peptide deformylase
MAMTKKDIITLPDVKLRQRSRRVAVITDDVKQLISDMKAATLDWEESRPHELGVALAAVQVGKLERVVIIRNNFDDKEDRRFVTLINPEVIKTEGETTYDQEGCLSIPDTYGLVPRADKVRVRALNENGQEIRVKAQGFLARVLQHEIDHTNGTVFIDHIKDQDAFYKLDEDGKLNKVSHESILKNHLLWK